MEVGGASEGCAADVAFGDGSSIQILQHESWH